MLSITRVAIEARDGLQVSGSANAANLLSHHSGAYKRAFYHGLWEALPDSRFVFPAPNDEA